MAVNKKRVLIVRSVLGISILIFGIAAYLYTRAEGAVDYDLNMKYKRAYWALLGVNFLMLLGLTIYQIWSHKREGGVDIGGK